MNSFIVLVIVACFISIPRSQAVYVYFNTASNTLVEFPKPPADYSVFQAVSDTLKVNFPTVSFDQRTQQVDVVCDSTIDAQYNEVTDTYVINYWQYLEAKFGSNTVATSVSITDLQAYIIYTRSLGVWDGNPDCFDLYDRLTALTVVPLLKQNQFIMTLDTMFVEENGLSMAFLCNGIVCTSNQLNDILQLSGGLFDFIKLLYSGV